MFQKIMKLSLLLLLSGVVWASDTTQGATYRVAKTTTIKLPAIHREVKAALKQTCQPCPPPPPLIQPNSSVPIPNPNALPGAFFPLYQPNGQKTANLLQTPPQTLGLVFEAGYQGVDPSFLGTPPDTFGVIGKEQFVVGDNQGMVSYNRQGIRDGLVDAEGASLVNLDGDFSLFISGYDARIRYDKLADRFIYIASNGDIFAIVNGFTIAVSDSGVLSDETVWTVFSLFDSDVAPDKNNCPSNQGYFNDYPCMGIDQNAIYVCFSNFSIDLGTWLSNSLYVIQKKSLYEGTGPVLITAFPDITRAADGSFVGSQDDYRTNSTVFPVDNYDPDPDYGYALCTDPVYFGRLQLFRILDAECPSLSKPVSINVMQTFASEIDLIARTPFPQNLYGDIGTIENIDDRLADSTMMHNKQIYSCHSILVDNTGVSSPQGDRKGVRWYQLDVTGDSKGKGACKEKVTTVPALVQGGTLFDTAETNPLYYIFPAIMANHQGDISIAGTVAGNNQNIAAFYVGRQASDPLGTLSIGNLPPSTYYTGSGYYTRALSPIFVPGGGQRWGDMSFSSLDLDNKTIWTIQEVAVNGSYRRVVARLDAPAENKQK